MSHAQASPMDRWTPGLISVVTIGFCAICAYVSLDVRRSHWDQARQAAGNITAAIQNDIGRNIELYDLSLLGVVENLALPEIGNVSPELRNIILFDRASTAKYMGSILVLNESGDVAIDSRSLTPRVENHADRDYFLVHQRGAVAGTYVSRLNVDVMGQYVVGISRRLEHPNGTFAGIVVGTLRLQYFRDLFNRVNLGNKSSIALIRTDGTLLARDPLRDEDIGRNLSSSVLFKHFSAASKSGSFETHSMSDGISRLFTYSQVGDLPLIVVVGIATGQIDAGWQKSALIVAALMVGLCLAIFTLMWRWRAELNRRSILERELATLARTDALTKLPNRRSFDQTMEREWKRAERKGDYLALLMVDADRFKSFNDRFGHQAGDELLARIGCAIAGAARRGSDFPARYGGEEFAVLLASPEPDMIGAVAEKIRRAVLDLAVDHSAAPSGFASVSVGAACIRAAQNTSPRDLIEAADRALFRAKDGGRNSVEFDVSVAALDVQRPPRLVA